MDPKFYSILLIFGDVVAHLFNLPIRRIYIYTIISCVSKIVFNNTSLLENKEKIYNKLTFLLFYRLIWSDYLQNKLL